MALTVKVLTGTLENDASPGYTDFTSSGFGTPDVVLVFASGAAVTANPNNISSISIGWWDGTSQYCNGVFLADNLADTRTSRIRKDDRIAAFSTYDGSTHTVIAEYTASAVTDGVRITLSVDNTGVERYATVVLIKGVTNKKVGSITQDNTTSPQDITGVGFKPDLVFFLSGNRTGLDETENAVLSFGIAHNSSSDSVTQGCVSFVSPNNLAEAVVNNSVNDACAERVYWRDGVTLNRKTVISAFDNYGFTITADQATTSILDYLAIELPDPDDAYVAIKDSKTTTGTQAYTGSGFTPIVLGLFGNNDTATNSTSSTPSGGMSFGWTDGTAQQSLIFGDEDGVSTTNVFSRADTNNVLNIRFDDDTADAVAELSSFDSDGWTLNYSDGSSAARKMLAIAIGNSVTAISLTGATSTQKNQGGTGVVSQVQALLSAISTGANASGTAAVTQAHALASSISSQLNQGGTGVAAVAHNLVSALSSEHHDGGSGVISQSHALASSLGVEAHESGTGSLSGAASLTSADSVQPNSALAAAISQIQILVSADCVQANASTTGTLSGVTDLTGADAVQANEGSSAALIVVHSLAAAVSTSVAESGTGAITAFHQLVAAGSIQVNQSGTGRLAGVAGWICATASAYPAVTATLGLSPAVTADTEVYPRGCH